MPFPNPETQFQPGRSGNPGGKAVGTRSITSRLRELLESNTIGGKPIRDGKQVADLVAEVIARQALNGDFRFVDLVMSRTEGKVPDKQEHSGPGGAPLTPVVIYVPDNGRDAPP